VEHCWKCDLKKKRCPLCGRCDECHDSSLACPGLPLLRELRERLGLGIPGESMAVHAMTQRLDQVLQRANRIEEEQGGSS
jgi:hypothetical protein